MNKGRRLSVCVRNVIGAFKTFVHLGVFVSLLVMNDAITWVIFSHATWPTLVPSWAVFIRIMFRLQAMDTVTITDLHSIGITQVRGLWWSHVPFPLFLLIALRLTMVLNENESP